MPRVPASVPESARRWTPAAEPPAPPTDRERLSFLLSLPDTAPDEYKQAAARQISGMIKVPDPDGRMWKGKPFATGAEYLDFMRGMEKSGNVWEYAADDELKAFAAADDAGKLGIARKAMGIADKAGEAGQRLQDAFAGYGLDDGHPDLRDAPEDALAANARLRADREARRRYNLEQTASSEPFREPRAKEEADADKKALDAWRTRRRDETLVAEHGAKLLDKNLWAVWLSVSPSLSEDARKIAEGAIRGRKLAGGDIAAFQRLDEREQAAVAKFARLSRDPKAGTFANTLGDAGIGFLNGMATLPANAAEQAARVTVSAAEAVFGKNEGLVDYAELNRRERERLRLEEALDDPAGIDPSGAEHGYLARSLIGFASTIPYMGYASLGGGVGGAAVALDMMQRLDDQVAAGGGDVYGRGPGYAAYKAVLGALYVGIEKVQAKPIFGPGLGLKDAMPFLKLGTRHGPAAVENVLAHWGKETFKETFQESLQAMVEAHGKSAGLELGPGWREAFRSGTEEFYETGGTMGIASALGTGLQARRTRSERGHSDIFEAAVGSLRRNSFLLSDNPYAGRGGDADAFAADREAARRMDGYRAEWKAGGAAALEKRPELTAGEAALLGHVFGGEAAGSEIGNIITGRNLWTRTPEGKDGHGGAGDLDLDSAYALWKEGGADRLSGSGFTEAGAAKIDGYFKSVEKVRDNIYAALSAEREADPNLPAARRAAIRERMEVQPLREVYQRAGTPQGAVKAFKELGFTEEQAEGLAEAFDDERRRAVSPKAAAAWRAAYLDSSREASPGERLRRMTGFDPRPAPGAGDGASLLTRRDKDGKVLGEIILRPEAEAFDPESRFAGEAVERATGGFITEADWNAYTPEERRGKAAELGIRALGGFTVTDPADPAVRADGAQADILTGKITLNPDAPSATVYHEAAHAWLDVMRRAGQLTEADIAKLRDAYGPSAADPAWFNEEAFADDIREIGAETDYTPDKPLARRFIDAVRRFSGAARAEESRRTAAAGARQALYESIVYGKPFGGVGDFAPLPKAAGPSGKAGEAADPIAGASTAAQPGTRNPEPETKNPKPETATPKPDTAPPKPDTSRWTAATPQGNIRVSGNWVIAPRDRFISDTDPRYDFSLQNRTRDAALGSSEQVAEIVAKFDALRLMDAPDTANGAPLAVPVTLKGADGKDETFYMVLSGNGRFRALDQLDAGHRGDEYRNPVKAFADARGIPYDPADMTEAARPRLVRVMPPSQTATLQRIAELSNQNAVLQMTDAERAYSDAALIERDGTADLYRTNKDGSTSRQGNEEFFRWFARAAGDASIMDSAGNVTDAGTRRAERGMLALLIGQGKNGKDTVRAWVEEAESLGLERQAAALRMAAGAVAALGERKPGYALDGEMSRAAADTLALARERKRKAVTADEFIGQADLFDEFRLTVAGLVRLLDSGRPAEGIAEALLRYADLAAKIDTSTDDMFGDADARKSELLKKAIADTDVKAPAGPRYSIATHTGDLSARLFRNGIVLRKRRYSEQRGDTGVFHDVWDIIDTATGDKMSGLLYSSENAAARAAMRIIADRADRVRYSIALAARRYALATAMPAEGEKLLGRQLEFLFARHMDPAYLDSRARATETRRANAAAEERRKTGAVRDASARAFGNPDSPEAWNAAFAASADGTVSRIIHEFFTGAGGPQRFPHSYGGKPLYGMRVDTPHDAAALLMPMRNPYQESLKAVFLDERNRVLGAEVCTVGLLNMAPAHPREVFRRGVELGATRVILAHNHPSGDPSPSREDRDLTERLAAAGRMLGIEYADHIITNGETFYSFESQGALAIDGQAMPDWEAFPAGRAKRIDTPELAAAFAAVLRQGAGNVIHAVILDSKNRVAAVRRIPFDPARIADPAYQDETVLREVFRAAASNPDAGILLDLTARAVTPEAARGLHRRAAEQARVMAIPVTDTLYHDGSGWAFSAEAGARVMPLEADAAAEPAAPRYSLSAVHPEQDAAYMKAVWAGDMETAQRMVDWVAYLKGYEPSDLYHGTDRFFNVYRDRWFGDADLPFGIFFSSDENAALKFAEMRYEDSKRAARWTGDKTAIKPLVKRSYLRFNAPLVIETAGKNHLEIEWNGNTGTKRIALAALRGGYDAVIFKDLVDQPISNELGYGFSRRNELHKHDVIAVRNADQIKSADPVTRDDQGRVIPLSERFNSQSPDIRYSLETSAAYHGDPADAPRRAIAKLRLMTSPAKLKAHPDYEAAKAGDRAAAIRVASALSKADRIQALAADHPGAVLVPVLAEEATGSNKLPDALAAVINVATGLKVDHGIVQSVRAHRTGQSHLYRMAHRPKFKGGVTEGQEYIIVDDLAAMGGTLAELRHYIETRGGTVVDAVTLAAARFASVFGLTPQTEARLAERFGVNYLTELLERSDLYGGNWKYLSEGEGRELLKALPPDGGRDGASAGREPRDQPLRGRAPGGDPRGVGNQNVRYALDLTGEAYSKENLLVGFMAHADLTGKSFPSRGTVAALAEKIGLEKHRYDELAQRARALAASAEDDAIRKAAASADPGNAAYAIGELARRAERALVRAGASEGERLARNEDRIRTLSEAGVAAAMRAVTGADYADIETDTDIDIAASILAADPKAFEPKPDAPVPNDTQPPPGTAQPEAEPDAPAEPGALPETDEDAPELTDKQRAEISRKRREREARIQALLDKARARAARSRFRDEERRRRKAANEKAEAEEQAAAGAGAGGAGTDAASPKADAGDAMAFGSGEAAPVDFSDRWEAAAFLRVWAFDRFRRDNPNRLDTQGDLARNKVAVEFYRKTAVRELTDLARKLLQPGAPRETVRAMIGDIVAGLTANQIERRTAHVFGVINRHAVREERRTLVKKFRAEIKRQFIKGKEFEELGVDLGRALTGAIEEDARYIMRVCELSDLAMDGETSALQEERGRLNAVIAQREGLTDEQGNPLPAGDDDMQARRALRQLALLDKYGAMADMMPGEILDLTGDALATLGREAVELHQRWEAYDALVKSIRDPLTRSITRGVDDPAAADSFLNRSADSLVSMLRQRLDFLTRFEKDPAKREAARAAVSDLMDLLARGNTDYTNAVAEDRAALMKALGEIFAKADGSPDRRAIRAYLRRLDEKIPRELAARLTRQGRQNEMTRGQMLNLLAYLDQWASYRDNIIRHGRSGQAALIRSFVYEDPKTGEAVRALSAEDTQLVEWLRRAHYAGKRGAISVVTRRLAGREVDSPDPLYHPVRFLTGRAAALQAAPGSAAWQPLSGVFSRRVRHNLDVDERVSILDLFHDRSHETAALTAFGERGMVIREALTSRGFQDAVRRFHGDKALSRILRQVAQSLNGGRPRGGASSAAAALAQRFSTYMYLGFNPHSAAKQTASLPVFAARLGFRKLGAILFSPVDREAVRRLKESDEYRARYGTGPASGMNAADRAAYDAPDADPLKKVFGDWGLWMTRKADWAVSAWVGQGVYRDLKAKYLDQGMGEADADRRAISETFTLIEETQQSGRSENLPEMSREHGFLGRLMVQFATSPLQQMQYEVKEFAEWRDLAANGGPEASIKEARNRFMRAAFINHVLVPGIMAGISALYKAATGDEPDWKKEGYWQTLLIAAIMGQFGRIFFAGALAEQTLRVLFLRKPPYMGQLVPAEGVIRFAGNLAFPVRDIVTWDTEHMRADVMRMLKSVALTRLPVNVYERLREDD